MDIYQEYRRSHERVKVMLSENTEEFPEKALSNPSAQENLKNFIKRHEVQVHEVNNNPPAEEPSGINLAEETILHPDITTNYSYDDMESNRPYDVNAEQYQEISNYSVPSEGYNGNVNRHDFTPKFQNTQYQENFQKPIKQPSTSHSKARNVEDELEDIIRDALINQQPPTNEPASDVDPELLNLMKGLLIKKLQPQAQNFQNYYPNNYEQSNNLPITDNFQPDYYNAESQPYTPNSNETKTTEQTNSTKSKADAFEKQLQNQQIPPKIPRSLNLDKTEDNKSNLEVIEPAFTPIEFDDDSSLALTRKELQAQVKNLIKETLENNQKETTKPNDLLELEKQLKEHIEKIKQSRQEK